MPLFLTGACYMVWTLLSMFCSINKIVSKRRATTVAVLYLIWPSLCSQTFSMFSCRQSCGDPLLWLNADLSEECFAGRHLFFISLVALPSLACYVVGLPVISLLMVHRLHQRERRKNIPRRLLKGHLVWGIMYDCYRRDVWWWEGTVAVRKIVIALVGVFGTTMADGMQIHVVLMFVVLVILSTGQVSVLMLAKKRFSVC